MIIDWDNGNEKKVNNLGEKKERKAKIDKSLFINSTSNNGMPSNL